MSIKVKFFASLREQAGVSECQVSFQEGMVATEVWRAAGCRFDLPSTALVAVNMEYARGDRRLSDGDEVAFFPPVTGG